MSHERLSVVENSIAATLPVSKQEVFQDKLLLSLQYGVLILLVVPTSNTDSVHVESANFVFVLLVFTSVEREGGGVEEALAEELLKGRSVEGGFTSRHDGLDVG